MGCANDLAPWEKVLCIMCQTFFCEICGVRHRKDFKHPLEVLDS